MLDFIRPFVGKGNKKKVKNKKCVSFFITFAAMNVSRVRKLVLVWLAIINMVALQTSCKTREQKIDLLPVSSVPVQEHSPEVFLVMYDEKVGKEPLLKAIKTYGCEVKYDYSIITGMALRKPKDKTLEETMALFRAVKGVVSVDYDHVYRLTDPIRPRLETR